MCESLSLRPIVIDFSIETSFTHDCSEFLQNIRTRSRFGEETAVCYNLFMCDCTSHDLNVWRVVIVSCGDIDAQELASVGNNK